MIALRPVNGALGSKRLESAPLVALPVLVADAEALDPPPVAEGLVSGLALPVIQVLTPLMMPFECALLNSSQMVVLVLVVWTLEPPRTSWREGMATLDNRQQARTVWREDMGQHTC